MTTDNQPKNGDSYRMQVRHVRSSDYVDINAVVDDWWGGRHVADKLQLLFFDHFQNTSFVIEEHGQIVAFLIGFLSQSRSDEAYIHFVGVHPEHRHRGLARQLYELFFASARKQGRRWIRCVTSPVNTDSIAFHTRLGFAIEQEAVLAEGASSGQIRFVCDLTQRI